MTQSQNEGKGITNIFMSKGDNLIQSKIITIEC